DWVLDRPKQRPIEVGLVAGVLQVIIDALKRGGVHRHESNLAALAVNAQMEHAAPLLQIFQLELAEFLTAQSVKQKRRQNRPVAFAFERLRVRRIEERAG